MFDLRIYIYIYIYVYVCVCVCVCGEKLKNIVIQNDFNIKNKSML